MILYELILSWRKLDLWIQELWANHQKMKSVVNRTNPTLKSCLSVCVSDSYSVSQVPLYNFPSVWSDCYYREYQICIKIKLENEYPWKLFLFGHWYWKYKFFHSNPLISSSPGFVTALHLPSGVEFFFVNNPPLSYIKSCILACRLQIWPSFLVLPRQNIE